jgi:hypothetical protein
LIKDENEYINEWLKWHIDIGFEHFYIYDNGSKTPIQESVEEQYLPLCTFIDYSSGYSCLQPDCYNHALNNYGPFTKWLAFIDTDEFIRTIDGKKINDFLKEFEEFDGLYVKWIMYNANGLYYKDNRPQRERFTQISSYDEWKPCGKSIIQPSKIKIMGTHFPAGVIGQYKMVDSNKNLKRTGLESFSDEEKIVIDHYFTRSFEEWQEKAARGSCDPRVDRKYNEFYLYNPDLIEYASEEIKVKTELKM